MSPPRILIIEDERALALALAAAVRQNGADSEIAPTAALARQQLNEKAAPFSAMILDIGLPDENGLDFLAGLPESQQVPTLVITAHGEIENTISARKLGVSEFLTKPLDFTLFKEALPRILSKPLPAQLDTPVRSTSPFIGASPAMRPVFQQIAHACATSGPVLISGKTGTGKSLAASLIRQNGYGAGKPFASFQPGAGELTNELTSALDQSSGGVLIIENVENLDPDSQKELVRRWESDGENFPQIVATSEGSLCKAVESGDVRSDLYYRLQVLEIQLPPLRERLEDLPALFDFFLGELKPGQALTVDDTVMEHLHNHDWPGNLRELRNVASYAVTVSWGANKIDSSNLPAHISGDVTKPVNNESGKLDKALGEWVLVKLNDTQAKEPPCYRDLAGKVEQLLIRQLLSRFDGNLSRMASELKANRTTLRKKLKE